MVEIFNRQQINGGGMMKHFLWLIKQMIKHIILGNLDGLIEAYYLLKIHICYKSKKIKKR